MKGARTSSRPELGAAETRVTIDWAALAANQRYVKVEEGRPDAVNADQGERYPVQTGP